ncbi:MAG: HEAT repeat domain-containing protein [Verrucomicrobiota bacterium]
MKLFHSILIGGVFLTRLHALEIAEVAAVAKGFDSPSGDAQYQARIELNRLIAQATVPDKGDRTAVTRVLLATLQAPGTSKEAAKYLLRALARVGTAEAVEPLAKILHGQDPRLKEEAREALSWIRTPQAAAVLEGELGTSADPRVQRGLIDGLAMQQSATSVAVLAPWIGNPDPELARAALTALARIGGPAALAALTQANSGTTLAPALKPDVELAQLVASDGEAATARTIYQSSGSATVRLAAFLALMTRAPASEQATVIAAALTSADADLRHAALARGLACNLASLQASLAQTLDQMPKEDRLVVLANIHHLQPAATAEKIALSRLASSEEDERIVAIAALGRIATQPAFAAVLQAVGAREPRVNQAAANALASMSYPAAESTLLAMLKGDSSADKVLAIKALVSRQVPDANAILVQTIKGSDPDAAKEAMKTFYYTAGVDDLGTLCALTTATENPDLRRNLASICSRIATRINTDEARALVKDLK